MREAAAAERKNIQDIEAQIELANDVNLDTELFRRNIENQKAETAFLEDLKKVRQKGIRGFPSFVIHDFKGSEIMIRGYNSFSFFQEAFQSLANRKLKANEIVANGANIASFIACYGKVTLKEICEVFDLVDEEAMKWMDKIRNETYGNQIKEQKAGNGSFYILDKQNASFCDLETGVCTGN